MGTLKGDKTILTLTVVVVNDVWEMDELSACKFYPNKERIE